MARPLHTRLRWVSAKKEQSIERFLRGLGFRVEIKQIVWQESKKQWVLWFVPEDTIYKDINSGKLKE